PDYRLDAGLGVARRAVAAAAVIEPGAALGARLLAHLREVFLRAMAVIGVAGGQHLLRHLAMPGGAGKLVDGLAVPIAAAPVETGEDRVDRRLGRSLRVSVLDAQQHLAAAPAGIEPVEQRGPSSADVEEAGRGRREAGDDGLSHAVQGKVQPTGQLARPCTIA